MFGSQAAQLASRLGSAMPRRPDHTHTKSQCMLPCVLSMVLGFEGRHQKEKRNGTQILPTRVLPFVPVPQPGQEANQEGRRNDIPCLACKVHCALLGMEFGRAQSGEGHQP